MKNLKRKEVTRMSNEPDRKAIRIADTKTAIEELKKLEAVLDKHRNPGKPHTYMFEALCGIQTAIFYLDSYIKDGGKG